MQAAGSYFKIWFGKYKKKYQMHLVNLVCKYYPLKILSIHNLQLLRSPGKHFKKKKKHPVLNSQFGFRPEDANPFLGWPWYCSAKLIGSSEMQRGKAAFQYCILEKNISSTLVSCCVYYYYLLLSKSDLDTYFTVN